MKAINLLGLVVWLLVILYDYFVWTNLLASGINQIGGLIGFGILALVSFPLTAGGAILGLALLVAD